MDVSKGFSGLSVENRVGVIQVFLQAGVNVAIGKTLTGYKGVYSVFKSHLVRAIFVTVRVDVFVKDSIFFIKIGRTG